jgi:dihydroneopterin aldolase
MLTIHLTNLQFYAHHGLYEEETAIGSKYEVNVLVSHREAKMPVLHINETIDYTAVYALVKKHMLKPRHLLEAVATTLAKDILDSFALADEVSIAIKKVTPPIVGFQGSVSVHYTTKREHND